ncbi:MAG TPA: RES family NAD+ phosphorylase [Steroidobacteraceae bacterium]|nr:RES family NAD+ phosphorylase [Steroidobacteraceae bacterium]
MPAGGAGLDYLLYTPFRYPPYIGSRFRAPHDRGVWYGARAVRSSCAELGYWRWRFVTDSHGLTRLHGVAHTVFQAIAAGRTIDLRREPFNRDARDWSHPSDYGPCQALARLAREADVRIVRYPSVRDPEHGECAAVLDLRAFAGCGAVRERQTWFLTVDRQRASWVRATPAATAGSAEAYEFVFSAAS